MKQTNSTSLRDGVRDLSLDEVDLVTGGSWGSWLGAAVLSAAATVVNPVLGIAVAEGAVIAGTSKPAG
jgi:hypothetical protein